MKKLAPVVKSSRRIRLIGFFLSFLGVWIVAAPIFAKLLIYERPTESADAIIVLSGSFTYKERTEKAAELFKQGAAPRIYLTDDGEVSGWAPNEAVNPSFVELARRALVANGVPPESIEILQPQVSGTIYEARLLSEKSRTAKLESVLIVTSAYHTRRALWTFQRVFSENEQPTKFGIASPPPGKQTPGPQLWWLSANGWNFVAAEYVKLTAYRMYY